MFSSCFSDRYPYFKAEDDRWKNSVRHNLSMNPHFRKGDKSKHGAGHLWVMADYDDEEGGGSADGGGGGDVHSGMEQVGRIINFELRKKCNL